MTVEPSRPVFVVKDWHALLLLIGMIVGGLFTFASTRDQGDENARRIRDIEQRKVIDQQAFQDYQQAIEKRLDRIEQKLDQRRH